MARRVIMGSTDGVSGNGASFAQIPNALLLAWARAHLSPVESAVVLVLVVRQIGAWDPGRRRVGRRDVRLSGAELARMTGFPRQRVFEAVNRLAERGILDVLDAGSGRRPRRLRLRTDARLVPVGAAECEDAGMVDEPAVPDLEASLSAMDPGLAAACRLAAESRGVVTRAGVSQSLEEEAS